MKRINLAKDFSPILRNKDKLQTDGRFTAKEFREKFLKDLMSPDWWSDPDKKITIDLGEVNILGPSWANEAFAYFTKYEPKKDVLFEKIIFEGLDDVWKRIIEMEIDHGYKDGF